MPRTGGCGMGAVKIVAVVLIVAGVLGLVYGGFTYTKKTHDAKLGPLQKAKNSTSCGPPEAS